ncbi:C2H2 finger domain transcription factor CON7 [Ceratocystis fimbriata CBS 114723]|uniref:C2H2 finger domain transcription factor CON7 n=1 Tax=Ceratocystis fimbriata CBS 114723 TaxID=1035309 RepID=A0A2C5WIR3_9PEZI|nr:C2H2 finger domain transcription factor CON7 [Ceratocystis fimbriata CBS 114723]
MDRSPNDYPQQSPTDYNSMYSGQQHSSQPGQQSTPQPSHQQPSQTPVAQTSQLPHHASAGRFSDMAGGRYTPGAIASPQHMAMSHSQTSTSSLNTNGTGYYSNTPNAYPAQPSNYTTGTSHYGAELANHSYGATPAYRSPTEWNGYPHSNIAPTSAFAPQTGAVTTPRSHVHNSHSTTHSHIHPSQYSFVSIPGSTQHKRPRRRYEEIERMYKCNFENKCEKAYGTLNHLNAHVTMQGHGPKRTPEEFKEIRKIWKARKKEQEARRKNQEENRGQSDSATPPDMAGPSSAYSSRPSTMQMPLPQIPASNFVSQYPPPPSSTNQSSLPDYSNGHSYPYPQYSFPHPNPDGSNDNGSGPASDQAGTNGSAHGHSHY